MFEPVAMEIGALWAQRTGNFSLQFCSEVRPRISIAEHDDFLELDSVEAGLAIHSF